MTVKGNELLRAPLSDTETEPRPGADMLGTWAVILVALQLVIGAAAPLKTTVPFSTAWVDPKLEPLIVTETPATPEFAEIPDTLAFGATVKLAPALDVALLVTTTFPVVAEFGTVAVRLVGVQEVVVVIIPLKVTVPEVPKFAPAITTDAAIGPVLGERLVVLGTTVNGSELLETPAAFTAT
jgi:hypothetical protein